MDLSSYYLKENGFFQAGLFAAACGKRFDDYFRKESTKALVNILQEEYPNVEIFRKGKKGEGRGIIVHPDLAIDVIKYVDPKLYLKLGGRRIELYTQQKQNDTKKTTLDKELLLKEYELRLLQYQVQLAEKQTLMLTARKNLLDPSSDSLFGFTNGQKSLVCFIHKDCSIGSPDTLDKHYMPFYDFHNRFVKVYEKELNRPFKENVPMFYGKVLSLFGARMSKEILNWPLDSSFGVHQEYIIGITLKEDTL